jgi:hypothetical protein
MEALQDRPDPLLDPAQYPFMKNSAAASLVYSPLRNSFRQAASFFSLTPGMEVRSSTINILSNGQTVHEAASNDEEGYATARSSVSSNFVPPVEFVVQLPSHFEPVRTKLVGFPLSVARL